MSLGEIVVGNALAGVCIYAWLHLPKAERGWSAFGYGSKRPMSAWGIVYLVSIMALMIWSLRLGHLAWFGSN